MNTNLELNVLAVCEYKGDGLWSGKQHTKVRIEKIVLLPECDENEPGYPSDAYIYVVFNVADWNTRKLGLPYTSKSFVNGIADLLRDELGDFADAIEWTEQGMQGRNYASVCVPFTKKAGLFRERFRELCEKYSGRVLT